MPEQCPQSRLRLAPQGGARNLGSGPAVSHAATAATDGVGTDLASFIALDFGTRRTGVAYASRLLGRAQPLATITAQGSDDRLTQVQARVREWQPQALVVGIPLHPDGAAHENTLRARRFARALRSRLALPVCEVDERYSTTEARSSGARDPDAGAACIILEQFLRSIA